MPEVGENMHAKMHQNLIINSEGNSHFEMIYVVISLTPNFNDDLLKSKLSN